MKVIFHSEAEFELCAAREWYGRQRHGLDAEFMHCIDEAIARIQRNPKMFPFALRNVRKTVVRRFPYIIYYEIGEREIVILAVFHAKRNPEDWQKRV
jgi:plasmid stabilization system protein ParE